MEWNVRILIPPFVSVCLFGEGRFPDVFEMSSQISEEILSIEDLKTVLWHVFQNSIFRKDPSKSCYAFFT